MEQVDGESRELRGWLHKRGAVRKSWRHRYFVSNGYDAHYYKERGANGEGQDRCGQIPLTSGAFAGVLNPADDHTPASARSCNDRSHVMWLVTHSPDRVWLLQAESQAEVDAWILHFRRSIWARTSVATADRIGPRPTMEDECVVAPGVFLSPAGATTTTGRLSLYGVLDGHAGKTSASFSALRFPSELKQQLAAGLVPKEALFNTFTEVDRLFLSNRHPKDRSGATACMALLEHDTGRLWVANCGDSRAVLCREGKPVALSKDHKPQDEQETMRIRRAGGFVKNLRVNGELAVSRSIGDADFPGIVIAEPDVENATLTINDDFLVIACDGVWDVMSNKHVVTFVNLCLSEGMSAQQAAEAVCDRALQRRTGDNVTCLLVIFPPGVRHSQ